VEGKGRDEEGGRRKGRERAREDKRGHKQLDCTCTCVLIYRGLSAHGLTTVARSAAPAKSREDPVHFMAAESNKRKMGWLCGAEERRICIEDACLCLWVSTQQVGRACDMTPLPRRKGARNSETLEHAVCVIRCSCSQPSTCALWSILAGKQE